MSKRNKGNKKTTPSPSQDEKETPVPEPVPPHPPASYDEYLARNNLREWPQRLTSESEFDVQNGFAGDAWSLDGIREQLENSANFGLEIFDELSIRVGDFSEKVALFSSCLTSAEDRPSESFPTLFHAPREENIIKPEDLEAVKLHPSFTQTIKNPKETFQEEVKALKTRNIEYVSFPGFRPKELTELPSQLEAPQLLNKVTEAQSFNKGFHFLWKRLFLSEASVSILQDTFWWFFLEIFEHNPIAQDKLFTRIADSYTALFLSVHQDIRDKFFKEYPRCLAQCVYLTFYEAFPESVGRFAEEFVSELAGLTSEWISGVRPPIADWKRWPWNKLCPCPNSKPDEPLPQTERAGIRRSAITAKDMHFDLSLPFGARTPMDVRINPAINVSNDEPSDHSETSSTKTNRKITFTREEVANAIKQTVASEASALAGPGPDMERVLFNVSGRSPLVSHHLYIKNLRDKHSVGKSMKRTEVVQEQPPGLTYQDIIDRSKKTMKKLQTQRIKSETQTRDHIMKLRQLHKKANDKMKKLQDKPTKDPMEIKRISEQVLDEAKVKGAYTYQPRFRETSFAKESTFNDNRNITKPQLK